ncbi:MAG: DUF6143 family protein, partial [Bacillota bacterium]|nr:DUF6143 family protein [Bacillota bacterium]
FVNVWTVTDLKEPPVRFQIWLNSKLPGSYTRSDLVTPTNTAVIPLPRSKVQLIQASDVTGNPDGGIKAYSRRTVPGETVLGDEEGKFIIPPGGNFAVFLSNTEGTDVPANVRVAYGWWEEARFN